MGALQCHSGVHGVTASAMGAFVAASLVPWGSSWGRSSAATGVFLVSSPVPCGYSQEHIGILMGAPSAFALCTGAPQYGYLCGLSHGSVRGSWVSWVMNRESHGDIHGRLVHGGIPGSIFSAMAKS